MRVASAWIVCVTALIAAVLWFRQDSGSARLSTASQASAHSSEELVARMREAFLDGRSVRVEYSSAEDGPVVSTTHSCRALTEEEKERVLRDIRSIVSRQRMALATPSDPGLPIVDQHLREASLRKHLALEESAISMIEKGFAFLSPSLIWELRTDSEWYYWNIRLKTPSEGNAVVYVPIRLTDVPDVAREVVRYNEVREYARTEDAFSWNSMDYEERRRIVDEAAAARHRYAEIEQALESLAANPARDGESGIAERRRALQLEASELVPVISRAPRTVDPTTLEFVRR